MLIWINWFIDAMDKKEIIEYTLDIINKHPLWNNPLLKDCRKGRLQLSDYQFVFTQFYLCSKRFANLLTTSLQQYQPAEHRDIILNNIWEEVAEAKVNQQYINSCRNGIENSAENHINAIVSEESTMLFINDYIHFFRPLDSNTLNATLAYTSNKIMSNLNFIFSEGLIQLGFREKHILIFQNAKRRNYAQEKVFECVTNYLSNAIKYFENCMNAIKHRMDLNHYFFQKIHRELKLMMANKANL